MPKYSRRGVVKSGVGASAAALLYVAPTMRTVGLTEVAYASAYPGNSVPNNEKGTNERANRPGQRP